MLFCLGITLDSHEARKKEKIGRKTTSRAKGKVERPFLTVKKAHEALYQVHQPKNEVEANEWMMRYLVSYNDQNHRTENHSRMEDWVANLPEAGFKAVCSWDKFRSFAREPVSKKVERDATILMDDGVRYEVSPELVDERVVVWWGLFDNELYVEHGDKRHGPYKPSGGPTQLHTFRRHKKTKREKTAERIEDLSETVTFSREVLSGKSEDSAVISLVKKPVPSSPYVDRFEFETPNFENQVVAKLAISQYLGKSIAELSDEAKAFISELVASTLNKQEVIGRTKTYIAKARRKGEHRAH